MKEALLLITMKKELAAYEKHTKAFYISKSLELQTKIELFQLEIEKIEKGLVQDIQSSELLKAHVKDAILERVSERALEKQLREG